jgi:hypothetical protein
LTNLYFIVILRKKDLFCPFYADHKKWRIWTERVGVLSSPALGEVGSGQRDLEAAKNTRDFSCEDFSAPLEGRVTSVISGIKRGVFFRKACRPDYDEGGDRSHRRTHCPKPLPTPRRAM